MQSDTSSQTNHDEDKNYRKSTIVLRSKDYYCTYCKRQGHTIHFCRTRQRNEQRNGKKSATRINNDRADYASKYGQNCGIGQQKNDASELMSMSHMPIQNQPPVFASFQQPAVQNQGQTTCVCCCQMKWDRKPFGNQNDSATTLSSHNQNNQANSIDPEELAILITHKLLDEMQKRKN